MAPIQKATCTSYDSEEACCTGYVGQSALQFRAGCPGQCQVSAPLIIAAEILTGDMSPPEVMIMIPFMYQSTGIALLSPRS